MWTIKHIYESDFGCEERMPNEPLTVGVITEEEFQQKKKMLLGL